MAERVAIVGTAQSWAKTPWQDSTLQVWSLNDAYRLNVPRADRWFDLHPLNQFVSPNGNGPITPADVPPGHYLRPKGYLDWLAKLAIPLILHPEYQTQYPLAAGWRHAKPLPVAAIRERFGDYFASGPAWMVAMAMLEGVTELHIYGIHLATEREYVEQRPNLELLLGQYLGHKVTRREEKGLRYYRTPIRLLVLPSESPILQHGHRYALEPRPRSVLEPMEYQRHALAARKQQHLEMLRTCPWWDIPRLRRELVQLGAECEDAGVALDREAIQAMPPAPRW